MDGRPVGVLRADSEDAREGIGVNLCQPPLLARVLIGPPELPGRGVEPRFELPRASEFWLKRWDPPFEPVRALLFPGRATSRPFPIDLPPAVPVVPRAEKKC